MNKVQVRCYRGYAVVDGEYNVEVEYTLPDFGYYTELYTDLRTGEIYALEIGDKNTASKTIDEIVAGIKCPITGRSLAGHLTKYPQSFLYKDKIGHFEPDKRYPNDEDSSIREFWEI
ncbi:hypothetical protein Emin_0458 [Elusimicrobium minutum Pei191]|uniref:Uncharacterized protein n=1 Tax=Elusimicrobium minutum (strain Pei191) TaxID=445932 RepID=B2KBJ3_ELUMP|nr:hypothetical protein [Elusimicrobium minutum]ACC98015.1 hypothetical protein Emin_0458 [Elusimicrobium minutum Pei191]